MTDNPFDAAKDIAPRNTILLGDCLERLRALPDESVDCCVTSPPYYGLRDYGTAKWEGGDAECDHSYFKGGNGAASAKQVSSAGTQKYQHTGLCPKCGAARTDMQLGLEPTPEQYIAAMVAVFEEVRRVLKPTGTLWLNIGDSYNSGASGGLGGSTLGGGQANQAQSNRSGRKVLRDCKPKDLLMIPARLALALQAAGWYLRSDIIWHKPNPMPESVKDRPTSAHEHIYLLTKSSKYHYDADAIAEPVSESMKGDRATFRGGCTYTGGAAFDNSNRKPNNSVGNKPRGSHKGSSFHRGKTAEHQLGRASEKERDDSSLLRNSRNVWTIATRPFKQAHFATFPPEIPRRCILAGCPPGGIVLDPFLGAGTTAVVAESLSRSWVGIELNPEYCEIAKARIIAARSK